MPDLLIDEIELSLEGGSAWPHLSAADGRAWLSWLQRREDGTHALMIARRDDSGWSAPMLVADGAEFFANWADFPSVVALDDGTLAAHWLEKSGPGTYAYHVKLRLSEDGGATWSESMIPYADRSETEHGFVSIVPLPEGQAAMVWLDGRAMADDDEGAMQLRAARLGPDGVVAPDVQVDDRTCECCQTGLVRTTEGLLVAYRNRTSDEIRDIAVSRFDGDRWLEPTLVAEDNWRMPACPVNGPQLAALGDTVAVVWFTGAGDVPRTNVAFSTDGGRSFGEPVRFDDGLPVGRVDVELLSADHSLVVWVENADVQAEVRARIVTRSGEVGPATTVSPTSAARASGFPRTVRLEDEVLVAWTEPADESRVHVVRVQVGW